MTLTMDTIRQAMARFGPPPPRYAGPLDGLQVFTSHYLDQFVMVTLQRWPRSKARRIRKKWAKDPRRKVRVPKKPLERYILKSPAGLHMHPETWDAVRHQLDPLEARERSRP